MSAPSYLLCIFSTKLKNFIICKVHHYANRVPHKHIFSETSNWNIIFMASTRVNFMAPGVFVKTDE